MRECAKIGCRGGAAATVAMRYGDRVLWVADLLDQRDPNLLDLCEEHADRLTPPVGWRRVDARVETGIAEAVASAALPGSSAA